MSYNYLPLDRKWLNFQQVKNLLDFDQLVSITFDAHERIVHCREYLDKKLQAGNELYYGINTGFGFLQNVQISADQVEQLQSNLLKSHACGLGEYLPHCRRASKRLKSLSNRPMGRKGSWRSCGGNIAAAGGQHGRPTSAWAENDRVDN